MSILSDDLYSEGIEFLLDILGDTSVMVTTDFPETTFNIRVISTELVGFVDDKLRKVFAFSQADVEAATSPGTQPKRGWQILDKNGIRWYMVNVRFDDAGMFEVRADTNLPEN